MNSFNKAPGLLLAASLVTGLGACASEHAPSEALPTMKPYVPVSSCEGPTPADFTATNALLAAPEAPQLIVRGKGGDGGEGYGPSADSYKQEIAKKLGLHIFRAPQALMVAELTLFDRTKKSESFDFYLKEAQSFTAKYGITLEVGKPDTPYQLGGHAPNKEELTSQSAKTTVMDIAAAFDGLPLEEVQLARAKRIVLLTGTNTQNFEAYVQPTKHDGVIYVDIAKTPQFLSPHTIDHEMYHLIDNAECGDHDMYADDAYVALNGAKQLYRGKEWDNTYPSFSSYELNQEYASLLSSVYKAGAAGNTIKACKAAATMKQLLRGIVAYSDYHPQVLEDKAEIGAEISNPEGYHNMLDPKYGIMSEKFRFLFARLYHASPAIAKYFAKVSDRPYDGDKAVMTYCPKES